MTMFCQSDTNESAMYNFQTLSLKERAVFCSSLLALPPGWNEDQVVSCLMKIRATPKVSQASYTWTIMGERNILSCFLLLLFFILGSQTCNLNI